MKRHPAYDHWQQRRPELRPIWWAVCGWLAVVCLRWLRSHPRPIELVPSLGSHNRLLGAIVVVAAAYDRTGALLHDVLLYDVLLYDQDGRPLSAVDDRGREGVRVDVNGSAVINAFPYSTSADGAAPAPPAVVVPRLSDDGRTTAVGPFAPYGDQLVSPTTRFGPVVSPASTMLVTAAPAPS